MDEALAIDGRVAIVTGAGNGLGRAEALALARAGARLVLNDLPGDAVQAVADEIATDGGQAVVAAGDVAESGREPVAGSPETDRHPAPPVRVGQTHQVNWYRRGAAGGQAGGRDPVQRRRFAHQAARLPGTISRSTTL